MVYPMLASPQARLSARREFQIFAATRPHFSQAACKSPPFAGFSLLLAASPDLQKSLTVRLDLSYAKGLTALFRAQNLYAKGKQFKSLVRV